MLESTLSAIVAVKINMKKTLNFTRILQCSLLAVLFLPGICGANDFSYSRGDLLLGFRKYNPAGNYELVVDVGNITNFLALPAGTNVTISRFTSSQLSDAFSDYNNLHWSVASSIVSIGGANGFPYETIWYTLPRSSPGTQTSVPSRFFSSQQSSPMHSIDSIGSGAVQLSGTGTTNTDDYSILVREAAGTGNSYSTFVEGVNDPSQGTYQDQWGYNVENVTPASFTSAVVSDLYQSVPIGDTDPNTGTNNGAAYYVGYFTLNTSGTMSFTRASIAVVTPPAPQIVAITRSGNTSTVFFTTTNGSFTYTLYYTNSAGLSAPATNWPASSASPIIGNGLTNSLSEITTATNRFYRVSVH